MRIDSSIKDHKSSSNIMGFYPIGSRHCWHGGIHIEGNLKVCAICDGVVVAYRMPEKYIEVKEEGKPEELAKKYSNGFVLIQHHYKSPKKQELIFYSLYHHLLPQKEYNSEAIPISFRKSIGYKACKGSCKKSGLQMWTGKKRGGDYIFIPNRGIVRKEPIKGDEFTPAEGYCRVVYKVKNEEIIGHVNTKCIASYNDGKLYLINYTKDSATRSNNSNDEKYKCFGVEVWKDKEKKVLLDIVDEGTVFKEGKEDGEFIRVKLSEKGKFLIDPEDGCGYIEKKNLESNYEWNAETDKIVNCKIPVKAGDCIGYCGLYTIKGGNYRASHIEVFTDDEKNLEGFLKNTKGDDMEKVEGKEEYEISNAYIKLSGELQQSFTYKLLANTDIVCLDEKGGYYKIKIGSSEQVVCTFPDRKELLKGTNVRYKPLGKGKVTGQYHVLKDITNTNVFGGLLKEGDILDFLETQDQAKANDLDRPSECPRKVRYSYPITGKEFWVKKICIVSDSSWMDLFPGVPQISYSKMPQSKLSAEYSYSLRTTGDGGNTVDIELYPEYPENNDLGKIEGEIILPLRECEVFEQDKNQKWYYIKNKDYKDPKGNSLRISGVVNAKEMDIFPAYNWEKFGFSISKQEKDKDTYIFDFDSATPLVKEVWSLVDEDGDKELTADEFRRAVHNKYKVDRLSKLICYHRSEWSYNDAQAWAKLENHIKSCFDKRIQKEKDSSLKAEKEKERDDKLVSYKEKFEKLGFWNEIKIDTSVEKEGETPLSPFPASPYVYHFNPIAFVEQMDKIFGRNYNMITFVVYSNHYIKKYIPKNIAEEFENKYCYIYHDKNGGEHEICVLESKSAPKMKYAKEKITCFPEITADKIEKDIFNVPGVDAEESRYYNKKDKNVLDYVITNGSYGFKKFIHEDNTQIVLVEMNKDGIKYCKEGVKIWFTFKSTVRYYGCPENVAAFIGALAQTGEEYISTGNALGDATSYPSVSHVNGQAFDFIYSTKQKDQAIITAMHEFGFQQILIGKTYNYENGIRYNNHDDHIHCGKFVKEIINIYIE